MNPLILTPPYVLNPIPAARGQSFVVTGAAGSIGSEVCRRLCSEGAHVTGVDIDENGLTYLSDITKWRQGEAFVGTGTYIHCAARKHVALGEEHKAEYVSTNVTGTLRVIQAAAIQEAKVIVVSTDKAVEATSIMGKTKRLAELTALAFGHTVVRLVNVYGSRGSVVPRWRRQIENEQPCTITDWNHRRFYMTVQHAAWTIVSRAVDPPFQRICLPSDYAELTTRQLFSAEFAGEKIPNVVEIGARAGERDREVLKHDFEVGETVLEPGLSAADLAAYRRWGVTEAVAV
jgi:FlaA1/EpsC-like NDP-sugar epimerase